MAEGGGTAVPIQTTLREDLLKGGIQGHQYKIKQGGVYTISDLYLGDLNNIKIKGTLEKGDVVEYSLRFHLDDKRYLGKHLDELAQSSNHPFGEWHADGPKEFP